MCHHAGTSLATVSGRTSKRGVSDLETSEMSLCDDRRYGETRILIFRDAADADLGEAGLDD